MMIIYLIIGIALIAWIVRQVIKKSDSAPTAPTAHTDEDKKDSTCCH